MQYKYLAAVQQAACLRRESQIGRVNTQSRLVNHHNGARDLSLVPRIRSLIHTAWTRKSHG